MARGWWTTSFGDRAKAQYQADQMAKAIAGTQSDLAARLSDAYQQGWIDGCAEMERRLRAAGILPSLDH